MSEELNDLGKRKRGRSQSKTDQTRWTDREMMDLAIAIQRYGSADIKNLALAVKTKSESTIQSLIDREVDATRRKMLKGTGIRKCNIRTMRPKRGTATGWPVVRKWQKIAQNQMVRSYAKLDYSGMIIPQVCDRFRDECPPPSSDQALDLQLVYGWMADCMRGRNPPELPPKESGLVLMLLRLLREFRQELDLNDEIKFIEDFKGAVQFVPFKIKDEFRKKKPKAESELPPGAIRIPEDVYLGLSRHRRLVQSFNPLQVPLWFLEKEMDCLTAMFGTSVNINGDQETEEMQAEQVWSGFFECPQLLTFGSCGVRGLYLFLSGYLLKRIVVHQNSTLATKLNTNVDCRDISHLRFLSENLNERKTSFFMNERPNFQLYNRAIIIIIDALSLDFVKSITPKPGSEFYQNKMPVLKQLMDSKPDQSRLFRLLADPPTTTLQRLKGLTTGSLPTFIDVSLNFASSEITEDNLIRQMLALKKKIVFMGDDTWDSLFPGHFYRSFSYPSFNVKDLDTVDDGILAHLYEEMDQSDSDVIIAHFLGVDHCGHRYGPKHPEMTRKLKQMNSVIQNVTSKLKEDTILFVLGDHGMTESGDHGGDSLPEITTALFVYSHLKLPTPEKSDVLTVNQVDLVPTLSILLGLPIPFSNLGKAITSLLSPNPKKVCFDSIKSYFPPNNKPKTSKKQPKGSLKCFLQPVILVCLITCIRLGTVFYKCREEQISCENSNMLTSLEKIHENQTYKLARLILSLGCEAVPVVIFLGTMCYNYTIKSQTVSAVCVKYGIFFVCILTSLRWWLNMVSPNVVDRILKGNEVLLTRTALLTSILMLITLITFPILMDKPWEHPSKEIYYGSYTTFVFILLQLLYLVCGDALSTSVMLMSVSAFLFAKLILISSTTAQPQIWLDVLIWSLLSRHWFYATAHQATFTSIQWDAAFLLNHKEVYSYVLSGSLVLANTFASFIFHGLALPVIMIPQDANFMTSKYLLRLHMKYVFIYGVKVLGTICAAFMLRRHLMVWKIFTPKLIYEVIGILISMISVSTGHFFMIKVTAQYHKLIRMNMNYMFSSKDQ
ncbi:hypothetical protein JTE90_016684 [Oedothorax gibbosus]|uniref:GPI ethanolamine phosphate transferase 3 n=1 Tax=Oedothorax gibbosus TaxID=931172 RepID=A0AAV6TVS5_9ARAC|nr:hypothetical protein JTE90_016684 [Oedothorax gibbosus]